MARVSATEVKEIRDTTLSDSAVDVFIGIANRIVTRELGNEATSQEKTDVELLLSAHFTTLKEQEEEQVDFGPRSVTYRGEGGLGLNASIYGQNAMDADPTGSLKQLNSSKKSLNYRVTGRDT